MRSLDMTKGSLFKKLFLFAIPIALTGILQQLFNSVDVAVVGRFVGKEAMAGVGTDAPIVGIIISLLEGMSLGTTVIVAHAIGRRDQKGVHVAVHTSWLFAIVAGALMTLIFEIIVPYLLMAMAVPDHVYPYALSYLRIYLAGLIIFALYNFEAAILRSAGHTRDPLYALLISGCLNVLLNLLFVIVFHLAVAGVALATLIANSVSALLLLHRLLTIQEDIQLHFHDLSLHKDALRQILHVGMPAGLQGMLFDISNIIVQWGINSLGTIAIAGSSAAFNIEVCVYYVVIAFAQACTTFVGQNYGAGDLKRCEKTLAFSLLLDGLATGLFCLILLLLSTPLLKLFTSSNPVIQIGRVQLFYMAIMYMFSMIQEVSSGYLRGFGVSIIPTLISIFGICGIRITWMMLYFPHHKNFETLMMVYPLSQGVTGFIILLSCFIFTHYMKKAYS